MPGVVLFAGIGPGTWHAYRRLMRRAASSQPVGRWCQASSNGEEERAFKFVKTGLSPDFGCNRDVLSVAGAVRRQSGAVWQMVISTF